MAKRETSEIIKEYFTLGLVIFIPFIIFVSLSSAPRYGLNMGEVNLEKGGFASNYNHNLSIDHFEKPNIRYFFSKIFELPLDLTWYVVCFKYKNSYPSNFKFKEFDNSTAIWTYYVENQTTNEINRQVYTETLFRNKAVCKTFDFKDKLVSEFRFPVQTPVVSSKIQKHLYFSKYPVACYGD